MMASSSPPPFTQVSRELMLTMAWPAAAAVSLSVAVGRRDVTASGLLLVAAGTMVAYGLDRLVDGRDRDPIRIRRALMICGALAALGAGVLACTAWWRFWVCAVLGVVAGAYVPLKRVIPKNVMTTVAWTGAIATLPFAARPALDSGFMASVVSVALIMAANTVLCDLPDVEADRRAGVRGITPRFGRRAGGTAAGLAAVLGVVCAASAARWGLALTAAGLALLAVPLARRPDRGPYRMLADGIVTFIPGPVSLFLG